MFDSDIPRGNTAPVIRAVGLRKKYPGTEALAGVSLDVHPGEVLCVVGPNGAGKTTLLYLLAGVIYPSAGHVTVFGRHRWADSFEIRRRSTFLPATPIVGDSPTPYEFLRFYAQIYGLSREDFHARLGRMSDELAYRPHVGKTWPRLSLGLGKKAGLIASFLPDVALRILDEPLAGGIDPMGVEVLYSWMAAARARGETVVFSTQVLEHAETIADRIALLSNGRLLAMGPPPQLIAAAGVDPAVPRALSKAFMRLTQEKQA